MLLGISGRLLKTMSINSGKSSYRLTVWLCQPISLLFQTGCLQTKDVEICVIRRRVDRLLFLILNLE